MKKIINKLYYNKTNWLDRIYFYEQNTILISNMCFDVINNRFSEYIKRLEIKYYIYCYNNIILLYIPKLQYIFQSFNDE